MATILKVFLTNTPVQIYCPHPIHSHKNLLKGNLCYNLVQQNEKKFCNKRFYKIGEMCGCSCNCYDKERYCKKKIEGGMERRKKGKNESRYHLILIFLPNSLIFKGIAQPMRTASQVKCVCFTRIAVNALDVQRIFGPFRI